MSGFLFNRQPAGKQGQDRPDGEAADSVLALAQAQSMTASAIFAMLVGKGVLSAPEAAQYMREIAQVLERDVPAPVGAEAGGTLARYADALAAAEG